MDCQEARLRFSELTLSAGNAGQADDSESVRRHLELCEVCAKAFETEHLRDRTLSRLIQAVEVPAGLESRLIQNCGSIPSLAMTPPSMRPAASRRRWSMTAVALVAVAASIGFVAWIFQPDRLTLAELETLVEVGDSNGTASSIEAGDRPAGWHQVGIREQSTRHVVGHDDLVAVAFTWRSRGSSDASSGRLWMIPAGRLTRADDLPDLSTAEIYRQRTTHLVWQEAGMVYLLELGNDVTSLRQLHEALRNARTVA